MKAVVLEQQGKISLRDVEISQQLGPGLVRIAPKVVGICGSDLHYYQEGRIGDFIVNEPMILGHEASGVVVEVGPGVSHLAVGDRVCMEPGVPDFTSLAAREGHYNLDPGVRFWATPPVHGCLRETVVHPASLTFKLPESVSMSAGALVEPLAIGVYSVSRSGLRVGEEAVVLGAGTIGLVIALAAKAAGCAKVWLADVNSKKLDFIRKLYPGSFSYLDLSRQSCSEALRAAGSQGVEVVFEASGSKKVYPGIAQLLRPAGVLVLVGMPSEAVSLDVVSLQVKEITVKTIFRYLNAFPATINLLASGQIKVEPLITSRYPFAQALNAFNHAASQSEDQIKIVIEMG